jgi:hypothetical protein
MIKQAIKTTTLFALLSNFTFGQVPPSSGVTVESEC